MIKAIIYESKTNHTLRYAKMLSDKLKIPYYTSAEAANHLTKEDKAIFLGRICAGKIQGKSKLQDNFNIVIYGAVGAYPFSSDYLNELKKSNQIDKPLFYLRGGINYSKLNIFKKIIVKLAGKAMKQKDSKTKEMFHKGYDFVSEKNIEEILKYIQINYSN